MRFFESSIHNPLNSFCFFRQPVKRQPIRAHLMWESYETDLRFGSKEALFAEILTKRTQIMG